MPSNSKPAKSAKEKAPAKAPVADPKDKSPDKHHPVAAARHPEPAKPAANGKHPEPTKNTAPLAATADAAKEFKEKALENLSGDLNEKIRYLIRLSKEQGYLTYADINEALPESVDNPEDIENVISILQNLEIDILDPDEVDNYKQRQEEAEEEE